MREYSYFLPNFGLLLLQHLLQLLVLFLQRVVLYHFEPDLFEGPQEGFEVDAGGVGGAVFGDVGEAALFANGPDLL